MELNADIHVEELVTEYPRAVGFLADQGIVCIRCGEPYWGTLRELANTRHLGDRIEAIVADLKSYLSQNPGA